MEMQHIFRKGLLQGIKFGENLYNFHKYNTMHLFAQSQRSVDLYFQAINNAD